MLNINTEYDKNCKSYIFLLLKYYKKTFSFTFAILFKLNLVIIDFILIRLVKTKQRNIKKTKKNHLNYQSFVDAIV